MCKISALRASGVSFCREAQDFSQIRLICSRCLLVVGRLRDIFFGRIYAQLSSFFLAFGNLSVALFKAQLLDMCLAR